MPKREIERRRERESGSSSMESSKFERERAWKQFGALAARVLHHCAVDHGSHGIWHSRKLSRALRLPFSLSVSCSLSLPAFEGALARRLWTRLARLDGLVNVGFAGHARHLLCLPSVYLVLSFGSVVLTGESLSIGLV